MEPVSVTRGAGCLVLAMPHAGTWLPDGVRAALNDRGRDLVDTDWHVDRLYAGLLPDATIVRANFHRYLIDANRDPGGQSLYPGRNTTDLVPLTDFDGEPIWNALPDAAGVDARRRAYHETYHAALAAELERTRRRHGTAVLYDCHSIRSRIPFLFDGVLPDFSIGTDGGATCSPEMEAATTAICKESGRSTVLNGRFRGGWTTRHHGRPETGIHAIQMELAQSAYLTAERAPFAYDPDRAATLRPHLKHVLETLVSLASGGLPNTGA